MAAVSLKIDASFAVFIHRLCLLRLKVNHSRTNMLPEGMIRIPVAALFANRLT